MATQKITPKNLSYDTSLPPFLAKLHAQAASGADSPDPILAARRRPRGPGRSASEEAEDTPLVLDEHGNAVALKVDDDGEIIAVEDKPEAESAQEGDGREGVQKKTDATSTGATFGSSGRKRKAGKVVGGEDDELKGNLDGGKNKTLGAKEPKEPADEPATKAKPKKKTKKIKLSFDDEGE